jgi:hypothetical protein
MNIRAVTVGRAGSRMARCYFGIWKRLVPLWCVKVYKARMNGKGKYTWRLDEHVGRTVAGKWPSDKLLLEGARYAKKHGLPFILNLKHSDPVRMTPIELLSHAGEE